MPWPCAPTILKSRATSSISHLSVIVSLRMTPLKLGKTGPGFAFARMHQMAHPSQAWLWFWLIIVTDKSPEMEMPWCGDSYGVLEPTWSCSARRAESPSSGSAGGVFIVTDFSERLSLLRDLWCSRLRSLTNGNRKKKKQNTEHQ